MDRNGKYFEAIETAPRAKIARVQEQRLLSQLEYVLERSALVKKTWHEAGVGLADVSSLADFKAKAPFIDKDSIRHYRDAHDDPFGGVLCCDLADVSSIGSSGGTTGDPTLFAEQYGAAGEWTNYFRIRDFWMTGLRPGDLVAELQIVMRGSGRRIFDELDTSTLHFSHDPAEVARFVEWTLRYRPSYLFHLSTPIIHGLARHAQQTGVDMKDVFSSYRCCIYGGELLGARPRAMLQEWGVKLFEFSSLGDCGTIFECEQHDGFHAWEDLVLVEILDPTTLQQVPDGGRGELVVSSLTDPTDPLIRYRSGDFVQYTNAPCRCGRTHMRMWILGRLGDEVVVGDKTILPRDVWPAIEDVESTAAGFFQVIRPQREMDQLRLRVGYDGKLVLGALQVAVADAVEKRLGVRPVVELVPNEELLKLGPPHKIPRIAKK